MCRVLRVVPLVIALISFLQIDANAQAIPKSIQGNVPAAVELGREALPTLSR